ncbi:MAG: L-threonylcarbamoyladenylate synthase [Candidatus Absconditabacterales bacterium]|nr:L-threonylcarbamoyladenylate synthase [Candidatus Absconditabacterales bacterium]
MSSDIHHIARTSRWLYLFTYLMAPLGYLVKIITAEMLSVEDFGMLYGLIGLVGLLGTYNDLGLTEALLHFLPKLHEPHHHRKRLGLIALASIAQITTSILISLFMIRGSSWLISGYLCASSCSPDLIAQLPVILRRFGCYFLFLNIGQVINTVLLTHHDTLWSQGLGRLRLCIILLGTIRLRRGDHGSLTGFIIVWILGFFVQLAIGSYRLIRTYGAFFRLSDTDMDGDPRRRDPPLTTSFISYGIQSLLGMNAGSILGHIDQQTILYFLGATTAGLMSVYLSINQIPILLLGPILGFVLPLVSTRWATHNLHGIKTLVSLFSTIFLIIGTGLAVFIMIMAEHIIIALFGTDFLATKYFLYRGTWITPVILINQLLLTTMAGIGRIKERNIILFIGMLIAVGGNLILVHIMDYRGVLLATTLATLCISLGLGWILPHECKPHFNRRLLAINACTLTATSLLTIFFLPDISTRVDSWLWCIVIGGLRGCVFVGVNRSLIKTLRTMLTQGNPITLPTTTAHNALAQGEVIGLPTETVYGLAADATNEEAVKKIFMIKNRPHDNPLIIHCDSLAMVEEYASFSHPWEKILLTHFSPGPFTIVLRDKGRLAPSVTAGQQTVCVRIPDHPLALDVIKAFGKPLAAPSANPSGKPSATTSMMVRAYFSPDILPILLDGGPCTGGIESTIVRIETQGTQHNCHILRPGLITQEDIKDTTKQAIEKGLLTQGNYTILDETNHTTHPTTPGSKYRHYAPRNPVILLTTIQKIPDRSILIATQEFWDTYTHHYDNAQTITWLNRGSEKKLTDCAARLYQLYHDCDQCFDQPIYIHTLPDHGLGKAIMNRVRKSIRMD